MVESRTIADVERDLRDARAEQDRLYWAFTRQAKAPPVPASVTRRVVALERELGALRRNS